MIRLRTLESVMNEIYQRVNLNKPFDKNLEPYSKKKLEETLNYFEEKEEFEKCQILNQFINERFNHGVDYLK